MPVNISPELSVPLAETFRLMGQPVRIQILLTIAKEEACVCHIEAALGIRQAVISQHLMVLRDAGLVATNRDGRNIYYRLSNTDVYDAQGKSPLVHIWTTLHFGDYMAYYLAMIYGVDPTPVEALVNFKASMKAAK